MVSPPTEAIYLHPVIPKRLQLHLSSFMTNFLVAEAFVTIFMDAFNCTLTPVFTAINVKGCILCAVLFLLDSSPFFVEKIM